jgi:23S rRNA pseudouridine1911/1915/1917 synthase
MSDKNGSLDQRTALAGDDHAGWRLDRFLAAALPDFSRSRLQQLLEAGAVSLGARTIKDANHRVKSGEAYVVAVPPTAPAVPQGQDIPLEVVYEDKDLIVINKPAGLVVHPAAGNPDGTLVNALIAHCGEDALAIGGEARPGIVHRLDKDTSGLLVAAKTERAMASLAKQFANHTIERAYNAVVWGAPRDSTGMIESQIGRSPFDRKRMVVLRGGGKFARSRYKVIEKFGPADRMPARNRPHAPDPRPSHPSGASPDRRSAVRPQPDAREGQVGCGIARFFGSRPIPPPGIARFCLGISAPWPAQDPAFRGPLACGFCGTCRGLAGIE